MTVFYIEGKSMNFQSVVLFFKQKMMNTVSIIMIKVKERSYFDFIGKNASDYSNWKFSFFKN